jgi:hypothetical protein
LENCHSLILVSVISAEAGLNLLPFEISVWKLGTMYGKLVLAKEYRYAHHVTYL